MDLAERERAAVERRLDRQALPSTPRKAAASALISNATLPARPATKAGRPAGETARPRSARVAKSSRPALSAMSSAERRCRRPAASRNCRGCSGPARQREARRGDAGRRRREGAVEGDRRDAGRHLRGRPRPGAEVPGCADDKTTRPSKRGDGPVRRSPVKVSLVAPGGSAVSRSTVQPWSLGEAVSFMFWMMPPARMPAGALRSTLPGTLGSGRPETTPTTRPTPSAGETTASGFAPNKPSKSTRSAARATSKRVVGAKASAAVPLRARVRPSSP